MYGYPPLPLPNHEPREQNLGGESYRIDDPVRHGLVVQQFCEPLGARRRVADDGQSLCARAECDDGRDNAVAHRRVTGGVPLRLPRGSAAEAVDLVGHEQRHTGAFAQGEQSCARTESEVAGLGARLTVRAEHCADARRQVKRHGGGVGRFGRVSVSVSYCSSRVSEHR